MERGHHRCDVSPFCGRIPAPLRRLGLDNGHPWRWVHLGPIRPGVTRVVEHAATGHSIVRMVPPTGGLGRFVGYSLDLFGRVSAPPGIAASYHQMTGLWYVFALSWRDPDGPRVEWRADSSGPGELLIRHRTDHDGVDADAIAGRCRELLLGRYAQPGRPRKHEEARVDSARVGVLAEEMKIADPDVTQDDIARKLGFDVRTIRRYRADARRIGWVVQCPDGSVEIRRRA